MFSTLHSYYLSGLSPFGTHLSCSAVPKTRHHTLSTALPMLSRAEVPVRQDGASHKVLQPVSAASSVNRPLQQSRLTEMQESPCRVPSFPPLSAVHLPLKRKVCHTPSFLTMDYSQHTGNGSPGWSDYQRMSYRFLLWKVETHQLCHSRVSNCTSLSW